MAGGFDAAGFDSDAFATSTPAVAHGPGQNLEALRSVRPVRGVMDAYAFSGLGRSVYTYRSRLGRR